MPQIASPVLMSSPEMQVFVPGIGQRFIATYRTRSQAMSE